MARYRVGPAPLQLVLALLAAALSACGARSGDPAAGGIDTSAWPQAALATADATTVNAPQFIAAGQLRDWGADLDARGLRATGSDAHEAYIDELYRRLAAAGVKQLRFESVPLTRWTTEQWSLDVVSGPSAGPVKLASYIPYSGVTPPQGVTAPLTYLDANTTPTAANAGGKIVLFDAPPANLFLAEFEIFAMGLYDPGHSTALLPTNPFTRLWTAGFATLDSLKAAGAAGGIGILPAKYARAHGLYVPYDRKLRGVPALYVDQDVGAQLKQLAANAPTMRLTLPAQVQQVNTRNLIGIIPGASDELTVINSHTDGTNGLEDNGPNAIVAMAQYLARLPAKSLPRTVMIMLSSGHFAGGVGVEGFLAAHASDGLLPRIASVTTLEHLGAQEWLPDANGDLAPTGNPEISALFMPEIQALADASCRMLVNSQTYPAVVDKPTNSSGDGTADNAVWPGEGQYFWGEGHIPTVNFITGPDYLINWGITTTDKIDFDRMRRQAIAFTQMQLDLSRVPAGTLRQQGTVVPKLCDTGLPL